ncbi:hypothetical protein BP6252_01770 [Coleophoma cylindrospora]|uniref:3-beta hydroxysteroid dehydrogenase/isomerase domain-containing protein n=1 Tax=Coleophoma cylindrospora TaxID=1849047 RepID=A0A3D8SVC3_9HELO|nr:hypothetical protein BP6252_01770 [Coleophoma cylindrospora]
MAGDLVFITGGTGHVGFAVLTDLLKAGYRVRASVRKAEQGDMLKAHAFVQPFAENFEAVVVPDICVEGAFDKVLSGVTYIEHIASPLPNPSEDPENDIVIPAIKGTTSMLDSAVKVPSVRRIVITSSAIAVVPGQAFVTGDEQNTYTPNSRLRPLPTAPWGSTLQAYQASKILALDAAEKFIVEQKPQFTIVNIMPGYVIGPNMLNTHPEQVPRGSNGGAMAPLIGQTENPRPAAISTLKDTARVHVGCLDENKVVGNRSFFVSSPKMANDDVKSIAEKHFPAAVKDGRLPLGGSTPSLTVTLDGSETTEIFGEMGTFEDAVKELIEQYLALKETAG